MGSTSSVVTPEISEQVMRDIMQLVSKLTGIQLGDNQKHMVKFRVLKRMNELGLRDGDAYLEYSREHLDSESQVLISLLTTHHTFFFREFMHFEFLEKDVLPKMVERLRKEGRKTIRVWSAVCSRGQEVYSLAMFLYHHLKETAPDFTFEILGTDVDEHSVSVAKNGVYRWDEVKEIPSIYLLNNWARGTGDIAAFAKIKKHLKDKCRFKAHNILKPLTAPGISDEYDIIFARNLFIYFNHRDIKTSVENILKNLNPAGMIFIGLSENIAGLALPVETVGPSVFVRKEQAALYKSAPSSVAQASSDSATPVKVLCVDDSPTVLMLLKKILTKENGFEIVGTATNGLEAAEMAKKVKFDIMTLDIHMPKQNGIDYLKASYGPTHPPVVVISSISREETELGLKALTLGARDYIEKPSLNDLNVRADEIRMKLKSALRSKSNVADLKLEKSFERTVKVASPDKASRLIVASLVEREKVAGFLSTRSSSEPCVFVAVPGPEQNSKTMADFLKSKGLATELIDSTKKPALNRVYVGTTKQISDFKKVTSGLKMSIVVIGDDLPSDLVGALKGWPKAEILLEDLETKNSAHADLRKVAAYCIPFISFKYHSDSYLS